MNNTNFSEILNQPAFDAIEPERKMMFSELAAKLQGKNNIAALSILMDFAKNMPKGREFSKHEQRAMIEVFTQSMPEKERVRFRELMKLADML